MKIAGLVLLPLLCRASAAPGLDTLIAAARSAPPEFAADSLIRTAGLPELDPKARAALLEDAFQRASGAQQPYKRRSALARPDGTSGYWNRVYSQDLDGLSLRLRAVSAMLPLDAAKARELFLRIPPPKLPRLSCEQFLVYDVARFYEVLGEVSRQGEPVLARYAAAIDSAVEVAPMARAIAASKLPDGDFKTAVEAFAKALGKIAGDDRSFTYAQTGKDIEALVNEARRRNMAVLPLLESYRVYLVFNLSAPRCADDDLMQSGGQSFGLLTGDAVDQQSADRVAFFNNRLRVPPLEPISELETTPSRLEGKATGLRFCQDEPCLAIGKELRGLIIRENGAPYLPADRNSAEWTAAFESFLRSLGEWKESPGLTPAEFFREKSVAFRELLNVTTTGASSGKAVRAFLEFIQASPMKENDRMEWFLPVNGLIGRLALDPAVYGKFAEELRQSPDPVIRLYTRLEAAAPRTADRVMPIL